MSNYVHLEMNVDMIKLDFLIFRLSDWGGHPPPIHAHHRDVGVFHPHNFILKL